MFISQRNTDVQQPWRSTHKSDRQVLMQYMKSCPQKVYVWKCVFFLFFNFYFFFLKFDEKWRKNTERADFNKQIDCGTAVCWSKYTTYIVLIEWTFPKQISENELPTPYVGFFCLFQPLNTWLVTKFAKCLYSSSSKLESFIMLIFYSHKGWCIQLNKS